MAFLPTTKEELNGAADFILVSADAYVDHPSFGHAVISRLLEAEGFSVGIIPQPKTENEYRALGAPRYAFLVSGGVVDSMVNNYTVAKQKRTADVYSEGGKTGRTPDRAVSVHTKNLKRYFPDSFVIIGGIEASLRRLAHYDYWSDSVRPSILEESGADLLIYGMGEKPLWEISARIKKGIPLQKIKDICGTGYLTTFDGIPNKIKEGIEKKTTKLLPSFREVQNDKRAYSKSFSAEYENSTFPGHALVQKEGKEYAVILPPQAPLTTEEMDRVYAFPYERTYHPRYKEGVPAVTEVRFSVTAHRGCFGGCNYCAITMHQGRAVSKRSDESILNEVKLLTELPDFKGYIHDVGGPSANFHAPSCKKQEKNGACKGKQCIGYENCPNLKADHAEYMELLRAIRKIPRVKKAFIRSGIRYDYLMMDRNRREILKELTEFHISGQLKVAPEHCVDRVLKVMNKPSVRLYEAFADLYRSVNKELGKEQYLVPYLISSHPGCTEKDAIELAVFLKKIHYRPEQVQDFYPTPGTKATAMYYTGVDPDTGKEIYVPRTKEEKKTQRALMQYWLPQNHETVRRALVRNGMQRLIGKGVGCLIPTVPTPINKKPKKG